MLYIHDLLPGKMPVINMKEHYAAYDINKMNSEQPSLSVQVGLERKHIILNVYKSS